MHLGFTVDLYAPDKERKKAAQGILRRFFVVFTTRFDRRMVSTRQARVVGLSHPIHG